MLWQCQLVSGLYQRMAGQEQGITFENLAVKAAICIKLLTAHLNGMAYTNRYLLKNLQY